MSEAEGDGPKGLGGWLILVILGLVISPVRIGYFLATAHLPLFRDGGWSELTTVGTAAYHHLWAPLLIFEIVGNVGSIVLAVVTLVLLVKRSRHTPLLAIAWLSWTAGFVAIDFIVADFIPAVAAQADPDSTKELIRSLVAAGIWIPYFLISKRVKATFVE